MFNLQGVKAFWGGAQGRLRLAQRHKPGTSVGRRIRIPRLEKLMARKDPLCSLNFQLRRSQVSPQLLRGLHVGGTSPALGDPGQVASLPKGPKNAVIGYPFLR